MVPCHDHGLIVTHRRPVVAQPFNGDQILSEVHATPVATPSGIKFSALTSSNSSLHFNGDQMTLALHGRPVAVSVGPNTTRRQS